MSDPTQRAEALVAALDEHLKRRERWHRRMSGTPTERDIAERDRWRAEARAALVAELAAALGAAR
jgi:hypothetical protein